MTKHNNEPKQIPSHEDGGLNQIKKEKTSTELRQQRLTAINKELSNLNQQPSSPEEIQQIQMQREQEYQSQLSSLEAGIGINLSDDSKMKIRQNMVKGVIEQALKNNKQFEGLTIQKIIIENIDNIDFRKKISPTQFEYLTEAAFEKALKQLIAINTDLPEADNIRLFRKTLEYYSTSSQVEKPLWHSTGSYSLRKGLEEGLEGGHGDEAGEGSINHKEGDEKQPHLSISYANAIPAETFQQIFARQSVGNKFDNNLKIDSVAITGQDLPQQFLDELFSSSSEDEKKQMAIDQVNARIDEKIALKNKYPGEKLRPSETDWIFNLSPNLAYLKIDDLTQEVYDRVAGEERKRAFIEGMDRVQPPQLEYIKKNILPEIKDNNLRETLLNEAEHPFPCFITFEGVGKDDKLYQNIYNKKPTVVPFEDFYLDAFYGNDIREIRVPENKIDQVKKWLDEKDLKHIKLVPLEVYEIKRIIEDNIDESLEQTLEQDYPFLAERKSKLQGIVHYDETFLEHMKNCLDELSGMEEEFRETFDNPAKQRKYLAIIKKVLILHEIGKLVTSEELEQMGFNISAKNEQDGAEVILAKYDQLNIHDKNEAQLISFLVRSYHDFFDIYTNQKQSLETQEEVLNFSREQQISPSDLLQLMRFVANANNLSAVETTNRNTDSNHTKEQLKDILNTVVDKMLIEIQKAE